MNYKAAGLTFLAVVAFVGYLLIGFLVTPWVLIIPVALFFGAILIGLPVLVIYWGFEDWLSRRKK